MSNVINFPSYRSSKSHDAVIAGSIGRCTVVPFIGRDAMEEYNDELAALERAAEGLSEAHSRGDIIDVLEWRDELDVLSIYTFNEDIRERCLDALKVSQEKATWRPQ